MKKTLPHGLCAGLTSLLLLLATLSHAETTTPFIEHSGYTVFEIDECGMDITSESDNELVLFGAQVNKLRGWSHIANREKGSEFEGVQLDAPRYKFTDSNYQANSNCNNVPTYNSVLVKKLADWDHQHANGLERRFYDDRMGVENLDTVVLEFKIHKQDTHIPSQEEIATHYGAYVDTSTLETLDKSEINLAVTLFETGADNQMYPSLNASMYLRLPPEEVFNKWLRVEIPAEKFDYYNEENYIPTPASAEDYPDYTMIGLRLNPENHTGDVLRNFLDGNLPEATTELFKEYNISLKKISIVVKDSSKEY
jgi:hypothetical protein